LGAVGLALALGACATSSYVFQPAVRGTALIAGRSAAYYPVPATSPQGDVRVASFGTTAIRLPEGPKLPVLQARLVVANNSGAPWTLDTRQQFGAIPGEGTSRPVFVGADADSAPLVTIPPGGQRTVDLFFPLPQGMTANDIPHFDVIWRIDAGGVPITERTPFERVEIVRSPPVDVGFGFGYGFGYGYGWYDPFWPSYTFVHPYFWYPPYPYPYGPYRRYYRH
jgi:hypothetical protein